MSGSLAPDPTQLPPPPQAATPAPTRNPFDGPNSWSNLMQLGGDMAQATNARTSGGFLANPGMSAFSIGLGELPKQTQELDDKGRASVDASLTAQQNNSASRSTQAGTLLDNEKKRIENLIQSGSIPFLQARQAAQLRELQTGGGPAPGDSSPTATPGPQTSVDPTDPKNPAYVITDPDLKARIINRSLASNDMAGKLPPEVLDSLFQQESGTHTGSGGWMPNARVPAMVKGPDGTMVPSNSTALGIAGVTASTAANPGLGMTGVAHESLTDPQNASNFAVGYLKAIGHSMGIDSAVDWAKPGNMAAVLARYHGLKADALGVTPTMYADQVLTRAKQAAAARAQSQPAPPSSGGAAQPASPTPALPPQTQGQASYPPSTPAASAPSPVAPVTMRTGGPDPTTLPPPSFQPADANGLPTKPYQTASLGSPPVPSSTGGQPGVTLAPDSAAPAPAPKLAQADTTPPASATEPSPPAPAPASDKVGLPLPAGYVTPELAMQKANFYQARAERQVLLGGAAMGFDPEPARRAAEQWRAYAADTMKTAAAPQTLRGEGSAILYPGGNIQTPVTKTMVGPDSREYNVTFNTLDKDGVTPPTNPTVAAQYPWAPPGTQSVMPSKLAPGEESSMKDASNDAFGETSRAAYAGAQSTLAGMQNIQRQLDALNAKGPDFWNTGAAATEKLELAKTINTAFAIVGGKPPFDPDKVASYEDLIKQSKTAGFALSRSLGSHEAASVVTQALSTVPNVENSPKGAQIVLNSIKGAAQNIIDQHAFNASWAQNPSFARPHNPNDMRGADVAFNEMYHPTKYVDRALSLTSPITPKEGQGPQDFLPGTLIRDPNGTVHAVQGDPKVWNPDGSLKYQPATYVGPGVSK